MKNNRGFTLVELIVVVLLLGVFATLTGVSVASASSSRARACAEEIDSFISMCRVKCLTRAGNPYIEIRAEDGKIVGCYYEKDAPAQTQELGSAGLDLTYTKRIADGTESACALPLKISFQRGDGSQRDVDGYLVTKITVNSPGGSYSVVLTPETGGHYVEGGA